MGDYLVLVKQRFFADKPHVLRVDEVARTLTLIEPEHASFCSDALSEHRATRRPVGRAPLACQNGTMELRPQV